MNTSALAHPATNRSAAHLASPVSTGISASVATTTISDERYTARDRRSAGAATRGHHAGQITSVVGGRDRGPTAAEARSRGHQRQDRRVDEPAHAHPDCHRPRPLRRRCGPGRGNAGTHAYRPGRGAGSPVADPLSLDTRSVVRSGRRRRARISPVTNSAVSDTRSLRRCRRRRPSGRPDAAQRACRGSPRRASEYG